MLGHDPGASSEYAPCEHGTEQCISDTDPGRSDTVFPTELSGVTDKDNGGKVAGTVSKSGKPGTYASAAEYEAVDIGGVLAAVETYADHHAEKEYKHHDLDNHFFKSSGLIRILDPAILAGRKIVYHGGVVM
jgi:hypothetical protein